ncbi:MAG: hypothetical protein ABIN91_13540 [Mucilaginibacter sp.]|uniref:hypothetical protein n=1 Tax=Mucilaginibacter sp. TaxID=1882438 RepID=UPI0032645F6F
MKFKNLVFNLKKHAASVDWKLLVFLILFLNVKIAVKVAAIILIYILQVDFKIGFSFKNTRLPLFYPIVIGVAVLNWIIFSSHTALNYNIVCLLGIGFWLLCILAMHQVKLMVETIGIETIHKTILVFFLINAAVSLFVLLNIICQIHDVNPYRFQGLYQKYFISTGDYVKGITFDVSTTNAVLNAFGVIYFLVRKNVAIVLLCMAIMLFTGSNTINLMLAGVLALLFAFKTTKDQKSIIVVCLMFLGVFMFKISPQNDEYLYRTYYRLRYREYPPNEVVNLYPVSITQKPDSVLSTEERQEKTAAIYMINAKKAWELKHNNILKWLASRKPQIPKASIHSPEYQNKIDTNNERRRLIAFVNTHKNSLPEARRLEMASIVPGKISAMQQTLSYLQQYPQKILTGAGIGNFSSKMAFKATNLGVAGGFSAKYAYINGSFLTNHLDLYLNFFGRSGDWHSLINSPNSVYDQLLSEYGLIGLIAFVVFYLGYFIKDYKKLTYGIPLLILISGILLLDYWFEQLSIIVFFELLMLVNIKENAIKTVSDGSE